MTDYSKITALYSRLSVGDEDRDGGESNSIQNQKIFLENYARGQHLTNIRHYIDDDESGRFFDRSAYGEKYDPVMMHDSKRDVANLLNEETGARSVRNLLRQTQKMQQMQQRREPKRHERER